MKPDEDLFDLLGKDESIPDLVEDEGDELSVGPERESYELYQAENKGEDDSDAAEGGARGEANGTSGLVLKCDEADSEPKEKGVEDKRVLHGEADDVDLPMIFDHEERYVAYSDGAFNDVKIDSGLEYNNEIDEDETMSNDDIPNTSSMWSMRTPVRTSEWKSLINVFKGEDDNLRAKIKGESEGEREENRSVAIEIDDDVETIIVKRENDLPIPPMEDSGREGDGDECPIDNLSEASSARH